MASQSRRRDAVEHIDTAFDSINDIPGRSHTHQIARLFCGKKRRGERYDTLDFATYFAYCDSTNCVTRQVEAGYTLDRSPPQFIVHTSLNNSEKRLVMRP